MLVALPSVAGATPPAGNVVANPGFETGCAGAPCNWQPNAGVTTFATSADAHSGAASLFVGFVVGNTALGGESDCITGLSDGDVFSLSYWIKGVSIVTSGLGVAKYYSDSSCGTSNGNFVLSGA